MKLSKAAQIWIDYHTTHSKKYTVRSYRSVIDRLCQDFDETELEQVTPDDILDFLYRFTNGNKPYTKRIRYSHLSSFFNFISNNVDPARGIPAIHP